MYDLNKMEFQWMIKWKEKQFSFHFAEKPHNVAKIASFK
jgi:hypothetical protein